MNHPSPSKATAPPLVVDLDGTLVRTDTLLETLFALAREHLSSLVSVLFSLRHGRAAFKARLVNRALPDIAVLPLNAELIEWLQRQRAIGRTLILATATDQRVANAIAERVGLFDEVIASDGERNLKGPTKAAALVERFGQGGYDYVGDSRADLPVWQAARRAIVVGSPKLRRVAGQIAQVETVLPPSNAKSQITGFLRALRPHQWVKNLLLFLPLFAAHLVTDVPSLLAAALGFIAFSLTASAVYLVNDLLDLPADRRHPRKCKRPFASGDLSLAWGVLLTPLLLLSAVILSLLTLPPLFSLVLGGYFMFTSAYSFGLKPKPIVDVILLAALYTVRVIAGAVAIAVVPSFWLLAFSMFIFFSLALSKLYTELRGLLARGELTAAGRGWHVDDLPLVQTLGTGAGLACVLVLALYIDSPPAQQLYVTPEVLWLVCPLLLYWISRLWFKIHRGETHDDPVVFALRDRVSLVTGAVIAGVVLLATVGMPR